MANFISIVGAFGAGAIVVKLIDILWLHKVMENSALRKWQRDNKLQAYKRLAEDLVTKNEWMKSTRSNDFKTLIGEISLLTDDDNLMDTIVAFYDDCLVSMQEIGMLHSLAREHGDDGLHDKAVDKLDKESFNYIIRANDIIKALRTDLYR
jgi:hypothetical protein